MRAHDIAPYRRVHERRLIQHDIIQPRPAQVIGVVRAVDADTAAAHVKINAFIALANAATSQVRCRRLQIAPDLRRHRVSRCQPPRHLTTMAGSLR